MNILLEHVDYTYQPGAINAWPALVDINLSVRSGEMVAVIGHGGSGKSTLSLLMAGLYRPTAGTVRVSDGGRDRFDQVGLVFQYPEQQLFGETVFEEIAFGARNHGTPEDYLPIKVRAALEMVGLDPELFWHRSPFTLSGGQKRRVCLASTLVFSPKIIILDEPTAGLDEGGRAWIQQLIQEQHRKGRTVIWITHNMAEAASLAQRIVVLDQGRILLEGRPEQVFAGEWVLHEAGLDIPQAAHFLRRAKEAGIDIPGKGVTVEQAHTELKSWLTGEPPPPPEPEPEPEEEQEEEAEAMVSEWREERRDV